MKADFMFTSESVTEGHPDKLCDLISDAIVDRFLAQDPCSRVHAECGVARGVVFIAARFASEGKVDVAEVARDIIGQVGYQDGDFSALDCTVMTSLNQLPRRDCFHVDSDDLTEAEIKRLTVRNQVTVFGFACGQTAVLMPLPIWLAHRLTRRHTAVRRDGTLAYLTPDAKTQVGVEYRGGKPHRIHSLTLIASQLQARKPSLEQFRDDITQHVIGPVFETEAVKPDQKTRIFINPDGALIGGGPAIHSGLTGRKNQVDTYGEYSRHSGSALSGKHPLRIDRVGAYAARHAAKNVVAAGLADECEVQLSYTIGLAAPVSVQVETFGTGKIDDAEIAAQVQEHFDFRLGGIIRKFQLRQLPVEHQGNFYTRLAAFGHVGRTDLDLPWEHTDMAKRLAQP